MLRHPTHCWLLACLICWLGCRSAPREVDYEIRRAAATATTAYSEGRLKEAEKYYRLTIKRAWLLDDPEEIGKAAQNLAVCLAAQDCNAEARDWLVEARMELARAGLSVAETWLIQAQLERAACDAGAAESAAQAALHCYCQRLDENTFPCLPCFCREKKERQPRWCIRKCRQEQAQAQANFELQAAIVRAELALDQGDTALAEQLLTQAQPWQAESTDQDASPALLHARARLAWCQGNPLAAARLFDQEADALRLAKDYRPIANAREAAALAYQEAGNARLAADRLYRAARMWYARDQRERALQQAELAAEMGAAASDSDTPIRASLVVLSLAKSAPPKRSRQTPVELDLTPDATPLPTPAQTSGTPSPADADPAPHLPYPPSE